jgi:hypothetical protein
MARRKSGAATPTWSWICTSRRMCAAIFSPAAAGIDSRPLFGRLTIVARYNTDWHFARNAGLGLEFAMGPIASFFVEARYMRINPNDAKSDFIPIRAGLRF